MATCKKCIHYELCECVGTSKMYPASSAGCRFFKDEEKYKEIVFCNEFERKFQNEWCPMWFGQINGKDYYKYHGDNFYCPYGKSKK